MIFLIISINHVKFATLNCCKLLLSASVHVRGGGGGGGGGALLVSCDYLLIAK